MQTYAHLMANAVHRLKPVVGETASQDARILLAHALGITRDRLILSLQNASEESIANRFEALINKRLQHQPIAQIIGIRQFWGRDFHVTPDVLDPRPETESLIATALEGDKPLSILDLGTGSGCILLTLLAEWPSATGLGVDISVDALEVAKTNAKQLGVHNASYIQSDWYDNISDRFDLIVSNPPYITAAEMDELDADVREWEPRIALTPEGDGLEAYRKLALGLSAHLALKGRALFEIGYQQAEDVKQIFKNAGFKSVHTIQDLNGHDRVISVAY